MTPEERDAKALEIFLRAATKEEEEIVKLSQKVERQRCMAAICPGCDAGWPLDGFDPKQVGVPVHQCPPSYSLCVLPCKAQPIRELNSSKIPKGCDDDT